MNNVASGPQGPNSLFDSFLLVLILGYFTRLPIIHYTEGDIPALVYICFLVLFDLFAFVWMLDVLIYAKLSLTTDQISSVGILPFLKKTILLEEVETYFVSTFPSFPRRFPIFTPQLVFKTKGGKYQNLLCSNRKILDGLAQMAADGRFRKVASMGDL